MRKPIVAVLMGGASSEREVSLRTGAGVVKALDSRGYAVIDIDVQTETGRELRGLKIDAAFIAMHGRFGEDGTLQTILEKARIPYTGSNSEASRRAMDKVESKQLFLRKGLDVPAYRLLVHGD